MTNQQVIDYFIAGIPPKDRSQRLFIKGNKLINYNTVIAINTGNVIYLTDDYFSRTTSIIVNKVAKTALVEGKGLVMESLDIYEEL